MTPTKYLSLTALILAVLSPGPASASDGDPIFSDDFKVPVLQDCPDCPTMIMIPAGTFSQGSPESEPQSRDNERPQRMVTVPAFYMGQTEVTFSEWDACVADGGCTHNPSDDGWGRGNRPVINVSWNDAQQYASWLSRKTGYQYRLPSESEWEYATRAGTTGPFNTGDALSSEQAKFSGTSPSPVGTFAPNAFGLYDTHGNVWEWTHDCWNNDYNGAPTDGRAWMTGDCSRAVARGGGWGFTVDRARSAARDGGSRGIRNAFIGFRVAKFNLPRGVFVDCADCPIMVKIPAGDFTQGSPTSDPYSFSSERPQRTVTVPTFAMGKHEVTFDQWGACVADGGCTHAPDDLGMGRGNRPVINVTWNDSQQYVTWLSNKTGREYRLPSESEWEYATRAGTSSRFNTGDCIASDQANFRGTEPGEGCPTGIFRNRTMAVGSFAPNAYGLYDTHGNVWEWVQDCWNNNYNGAPTDGRAWMTGDCSLAVLRGGSWAIGGMALRSAGRVSYSRDSRSPRYPGFRVAASLEP